MPEVVNIDLNTVIFPVYEHPSQPNLVNRCNLQTLAKAMNEAKLKAKVEGEMIVFVPEDQE